MLYLFILLHLVETKYYVRYMHPTVPARWTCFGNAVIVKVPFLPLYLVDSLAQ